MVGSAHITKNKESQAVETMTSKVNGKIGILILTHCRYETLKTEICVQGMMSREVVIPVYHV